jgi:hypothetical protein
LTQVTTLVDQTTDAEAVAELLYLLRLIDIFTQYWDADRAIRKIKKISESNPDSFIVTKYFVKALMQTTEFQLGADERDRYTNLQLAEKLNEVVLIKKHGHRKETIKLQLKRFIHFKNFMTVAEH